MKVPSRFLIAYCVLSLTGALCLPVGAQTVAGAIPADFSVSEGGAAVYRVPIQVPPGIAGMAPKLELTYNSQNGNGLLGMGWGLGGLSAITRCPRTMAQDGVRGAVNYDNNDRYCMNGQRLVLVSGSYGAPGSEYRTELDSFSKIIANGTAGNGPASFTVQTKVGLTLEYGNTTDSRIEAQGKPTVQVWTVNKISDAKTNYMTVTYTENNALGEYYPIRIDYVGNVTAGQAPTSSVRFSYEARPDLSTGYHAGSLMKNTQRMTSVKTYNAEDLVMDYRLTYETGTSSKRSRLKTLTQCEPLGTCLAPVSLAWSEVVPATTVSQQVHEGPSINFGSATNYVKYAVDVNGDGKSDLLLIHTGSDGFYAYTALGRGDGTFEPLKGGLLMADNFGSTTAYDKFVADFNADGKLDLVVMTTGGSGFYAYTAMGRGDGTFEPARGGVLRSGNFGDTYTRAVGDFNGDGKTDLVVISTGQIGNGFSAYTALGRGDGTFEPLVGGPIAISGGYGSLSTTYDKFVADVNGDGKSDVVLMTTGGSGFWAYVALGRGDGTFEVPKGGAFRTDNFGDTYTRAIGDFNGDGKPDLVVISTGQVGNGFSAYTAIGRGDGTFEPLIGGPISISGGYGSLSATYDKVVTDVNGDGKSDVVLMYTGGGGFYVYTALGRGDGTFEVPIGGQLIAGNFDSTFAKVVADINGDGKSDPMALYNVNISLYAYTSLSTPGLPDLLSTTTNGSSPSTTLSYQALSQPGAPSIYTKDSGTNATVYPKVDLQTPLYVVATSTTGNGLDGTNTTNYTYGGLKAELGTGRGMLGFRWTSAKSLDTGIELYTEYKQDWPYTGLVAKTETRLAGSGNAGVLKRSTNTFNQGTGSASASLFIYPGQAIEESWDLSGSAYPTVTNSYQYAQSPQYGDPTQITVSNSAGTSKTTTNDYWPANTSNGNWILGRLQKTKVTSTTPDSTVTAATNQEGISVAAPTDLSIGNAVPDNFDPATYLYFNPDVAADGIDPATHFVRYGRFEDRLWKRGQSGDGSTVLPRGFDAATYLYLNPDVAADRGTDAATHFLRYGRFEGRMWSRGYPNDHSTLLPRGFNAATYLYLNPDVAADRGIDAATHFLRYGRFEGRMWSRGYPNDRSTLLPGGFDAATYLYLNPDVAADRGIDAATHFLRHGRFEGRMWSRGYPNDRSTLLPRGFDAATYLYLNPDVAAARDIDAATHFLRYGRFEGRMWSRGYRGDGSTLLPRGFDGATYRRLNPDVAADGIDPAQHYRLYGRFEGRRWN